jgi:hypothetical protein
VTHYELTINQVIFQLLDKALRSANNTSTTHRIFTNAFEKTTTTLLLLFANAFKPIVASKEEQTGECTDGYANVVKFLKQTQATRLHVATSREQCNSATSVVTWVTLTLTLRRLLDAAIDCFLKPLQAYSVPWRREHWPCTLKKSKYEALSHTVF